MKKIIILFIFIFSAHFIFAQVFFDSTTKKLRYAGAMKPEVMTLLNKEEKELIDDCIIECGISPDSVIWITKKVFDKTTESDYYNSKMIYKSTSNRKGNIQTFRGEHNLEKPQFLIFLDRTTDIYEFEVVLLMYY